ncbi:MAG: hypothetical protein WC435_03560 [Candidatus Paceibacterota bacterium]
MPKKLVIAGSASLQEKIQYWKSFWENKGFKVIDYPVSIPTEIFESEYPKVHKNFFNSLENTDILFVMNEDKNNITGYVGAESFAETVFAVTNNLIHNKNVEILLLKMPDKNVQSYNEIVLWLKLGWIKLFKENIS